MVRWAPSEGSDGRPKMTPRSGRPGKRSGHVVRSDRRTGTVGEPSSRDLKRADRIATLTNFRRRKTFPWRPSSLSARTLEVRFTARATYRPKAISVVAEFRRDHVTDDRLPCVDSRGNRSHHPIRRSIDPFTATSRTLCGTVGERSLWFEACSDRRKSLSRRGRVGG